MSQQLHPKMTRQTPPLKLSEDSFKFLTRVKKEGGDPGAMASILLELAIQMLRSGHIHSGPEGLTCHTDKGTVKVKLR